MNAPARCTVPGSACRMLQLDLPGARPGWAALDAAGQRRFTGALTLHLEPDVHVWFRDGAVLYAERAGGRSLEQVLLDASVVTTDQLARGVVELAGTRHVGRLFEREPALDRDLVELAVELATAELLGEIADRTVPAVTLSPYRFHPSGIHRWAEHPSPPARPTPPAATDTVVHDASVAVVATAATTGPVDTPVVDRTVVAATPAPTAAPETPAVDPHPAFDLRRVIEEVAEEREGLPRFDDVLPQFDDGDHSTEVPEDVRAAVRLALAEIEAATRPALTDGLTVDALLDLGGHDPTHGEHATESEEHPHGLRRLLGSRHP